MTEPGDSSAAPTALFVYGTLRAGAAAPAHDRWVSRLRSLGRGTVPGRLHDAGRYPTAVPSSDPEDRIVGEAYALPADPAVLLAALDGYEGYDPADPEGSVFVRSTVTVRLDAGGTVGAWIYRVSEAVQGLPRIASGDWLERGPERAFEAGRAAD
jgi:gamma-glutamylcyclotransferase (GGCT)/AIG2-like uncharacterized protein YtfP